jgi:predicted Zn-dependent protease
MFKLTGAKKTSFALSLILVMTLLLTPVVQAASIAEILLGGAIEYIYLQETLKNYNNNHNKEILATYKSEYGVNEDTRANQQLDHVMTSLVATLKNRGEKIEPEYSWFVNKEETFNAFCGLGHNISVNIGLFKYLNYNEDELAFVLAHELVHGQKNHALNSVKKTIPISIAQSLYTANNPDTSSYILSSIAANMAVAKYSTLPMEREADKISYTYAVESGYNPGAGAAIWAKVLLQNGDNAGSIFEKVVNPNDHPTNSQRIKFFADCLNDYSRDQVEVKDKTIYVKNKSWATPAAANGQLDIERAYFIAGNLAAVFHDNPKGLNAYTEGNTVKINGKLIMTSNSGDPSAPELTRTLNQILNS